MALAAQARARSSTQEEMIRVEMAEMRVSSCPSDHLVAYGLGACIGVCLYDAASRIAGMANIVMPEQVLQLVGSTNPAPSIYSGKFADTALPILVDQISRSGGRAENLTAAIAGGAQIFGAAVGQSSLPSNLEIGERNAVSVRAALENIGIPIIGEDIGGSHGRTLAFRVFDGSVIVKPIGREARVLAMLGKPRLTIHQ